MTTRSFKTFSVYEIKQVKIFQFLNKSKTKTRLKFNINWTTLDKILKNEIIFNETDIRDFLEKF